MFGGQENAVERNTWGWYCSNGGDICSHSGMELNVSLDSRNNVIIGCEDIEGEN
jgi:hypothetical protein